VDPEKLDDETAIKMAAKIRSPKLESKHIEAQYRKDFYVDPEDVTIDDTQKNLVEANRIQRAADDKQFLKGYINKQFNPPVDTSRAAAEQAAQAAVQYWQAQAPSIATGLKDISDEIKFNVVGTKGEEALSAKYSFSVPENDLTELTNRAIQAAVKAGVPQNEEGKKAVQQHVAELVQAKYGRQMLQSALAAQQTEFISYMQREFHNAGAPGGGGQGGGGQGGPKTREDVIMDKFKNSP
jgi:hypothetical protein